MLAAAAPLAGLLPACGFHPRGSMALAFRRLYIDLPQNSPMRARLRQLIDNTSNTTVVSDRKDADAFLDVLAEDRAKTILSLTSQGVVREYRLTYRFRFQLRGPDDRVLIPSSDIVQFRDLSYQETQALAKDYEEAMLYRDMQSEALNQLMRRLAMAGQPS